MTSNLVEVVGAVMKLASCWVGRREGPSSAALEDVGGLADKLLSSRSSTSRSSKVNNS